MEPTADYRAAGSDRQPKKGRPYPIPVEVLDAAIFGALTEWDRIREKLGRLGKHEDLTPLRLAQAVEGHGLRDRIVIRRVWELVAAGSLLVEATRGDWFYESVIRVRLAQPAADPQPEQSNG